MTTIKVIELLKGCKPDELNKLEQFLELPSNNPYHRGHILKLFGKIKGLHPNFETQKSNKEALFGYLFPDEQYEQISTQRELKFRNILFRFSEAIRKYFIWQELEQNQWQEDSLLLTIYKERDIVNQYNFLQKKLHQKLERNKLSHKQYYYHQWKLAKLNHNFKAEHPNIKITNNKNYTLANLQNKLTLNFIIEQLQVSCEMTKAND